MRVLSFIAAVGVFVMANAQSYTTTFDATENPISEGGKWIRNSSVGSFWWHNVRTENGYAKGDANYPDWWTDPTAILAGTWGPDQTAQATIWANSSAQDQSEAELRLRTTLKAGSNAGYEFCFCVNKTSSAYMYIVRWNGPEQDYSILAEGDGASYGVANGDVVKATVIGNVFSAYVNGIQKLQATDNTFPTGSPGIGFDENGQGNWKNYGFTDYTVTATGGTTGARAGQSHRVNVAHNTSPSSRTIIVGTPGSGVLHGEVHGSSGALVASFEASAGKEGGGKSSGFSIAGKQVRFDGKKSRLTNGVYILCQSRLPCRIGW